MEKNLMKKAMAFCLAACLSVSSVLIVPAAAETDLPETNLAEERWENSLTDLFPDEAFRAYIAENVDIDGDGVLSQQEIADVSSLTVAGLGITSLEGIGVFSALETLDCSNNALGALDLSGLDQLQTLICTGNQISLQVNGENQVDFSGIPGIDFEKILAISQGSWAANGLLQLPSDVHPDELSYVYSVAGAHPETSWELQVTVHLGYAAGNEEEGTEEAPAGQAKTPVDTPDTLSGGNTAAEETSSQENSRAQVNENANSIVEESPNSTAEIMATSAKITSCKILSNKTQVAVQASIPSKVASQDGYYYLFSISTLSSKLSKPAAKVKKAKKVTFQVSLGWKLQNKFIVAVKKNGKYKAITSAKYISNPQILAGSTLPFTKGKSKKGLQFAESVQDAISLGTNYCLFNDNITNFTKNTGNKLKYTYKGKNYYFNRDEFDRLGSLFSQFQDANMNLSVEFLLPWSAGQTDLIYPAARNQNAQHAFYAWNVRSAATRDKLEALFSCIAEQFDGQHGRGYINNYIIGNEVNAFNQWHYTGSTNLKTNAYLYADTFQMVYMAVKSKCKNARISLCIDQTWSIEAPGLLHSGKAFLNAVAYRLKKYGSPTFSIAFHAYSHPLTQTDFWNNSAQFVRNSVDSPCITMKNIEYLAKYVKSKYGKKTRIMLTEQGFSSHGTNGQKKQAAAIAYAFYKAEFNDMIDCIIFRCQADAQAEITGSGLYMGLWTVGMGKKKPSYNVFKYMDTPKCESATKACRQYLNVSSWKKLVPSYKASHFK